MDTGKTQTIESKRNVLANLVQQAKKVGRDPVKVDFEACEKEVVRRFIDRRKRKGTPRRESLLRMCDLLGRRLDRRGWKDLFEADKVNNLPVLVGGHGIRADRERTDWTNKCFGLAEVNPGVFVVGLNRIFFSNASVVDLVVPDGH